jgi:hypothetical protein
VNALPAIAAAPAEEQPTAPKPVEQITPVNALPAIAAAPTKKPPTPAVAQPRAPIGNEYFSAFYPFKIPGKEEAIDLGIDVWGGKKRETLPNIFQVAGKEPTAQTGIPNELVQAIMVFARAVSDFNRGSSSAAEKIAQAAGKLSEPTEIVLASPLPYGVSVGKS